MLYCNKGTFKYHMTFWQNLCSLKMTHFNDVLTQTAQIVRIYLFLVLSIKYLSSSNDFRIM